jgi:hypothetical protein
MNKVLVESKMHFYSQFYLKLHLNSFTSQCGTSVDHFLFLTVVLKAQFSLLNDGF